MSKGPESAWQNSIKNSRVESYLRVHGKFDQRTNIFGQYYENDIYTDADGNEFYPWMFSKTLMHDPATGFAKKSDIDDVTKAILSGTATNLDSINTVGQRKMEGPQTVLSFNLIGNDSLMHDFPGTAYATIDSKQHSFEIMEVYAKSLLRDTAFQNYAFSSEAENIIDALNTYGADISAPTENNLITPQTLFRGNGPDETIGPYISQFLLRTFNYGNLRIDQKYVLELDPKNALSMVNWVEQQNGNVTASIRSEADPLFNFNGRVLGSKVHNDPLYQFYYNAALIALEPIGIEEPEYQSVSAWTDGGGPSVLSTVAGVAIGALRAAWYQKYGLTMKIRPEVMAQRITLGSKDANLKANIPKMAAVVDNTMGAQAILDMVNAANVAADGEDMGGKNYLLNTLFPEGSPTHPSLPAGHATVAGACTTVLKAMLKTHDGTRRITWSEIGLTPQIASSDGRTLENYTVDDAANMTIIGELNKLASNVSIGRNFAGVHYRCDGHCGMRTGEDYAISYLIDISSEYQSCYNGVFQGWTLEKFDGTTIHITKNGVTTL
jgi:hypothetical protein